MSKTPVNFIISAHDRASAAFHKVQGNIGRLHSQMQRFNSGGGIGGLLAVGGGAVGIKSITDAADKMASVRSRMNNVFGDVDKGGQAFKDSFKASQELGVGFDSFGSSVARLAPIYSELNRPQGEVIRNTKTLTGLLKLGGATAEETNSVLLQYSQAMASGVLRGEEFNAISEASYPVQKAIANALHVSTTELRGMAKDGELTSNVLIKAMNEAESYVNKGIGNLPNLFGSSIARVSNLWDLFIGRIGEIGSFKSIFKSFDTLTDKVTAFVNNDEKMENLGNKIKGVIDFAIQATPVFIGAAVAVKGFGLALSLISAGAGGLVVAKIALLGATLVLAYQHSESFRTSVSGLWDSLGNLANALGVTGSFGENFGKAMGFVGDSLAIVVGFITDAVDGIAALGKAYQAFKAGGIGAGFDSIETSFSHSWENADRATQRFLHPVQGSDRSMPTLTNGGSAIQLANNPAMAQIQQSAQSNVQAASQNLQSSAKQTEAGTKAIAASDKQMQAASMMATAADRIATAAANMQNIQVNVNQGFTPATRSTLNAGAMS